jgi:peptidoglycan/LPS O-acetylase OafA/YrhL
MSGNSAQVPPGLPDGYHPPVPPGQGGIVFLPIVHWPPASRPRTAAGVGSITLAVVELVQFFPTWFVALAAGSGAFAELAALLLVSVLGNFALGIALLAGRRGRRRTVPLLAAGFAAMAITLCLVDVVSVAYTSDILAPTLAVTLVPALAVLVLIRAALRREQTEAHR